MDIEREYTTVPGELLTVHTQHGDVVINVGEHTTMITGIEQRDGIPTKSVVLMDDYAVGQMFPAGPTPEPTPVPPPPPRVYKGWGQPILSRKFHYFDSESAPAGESLCGRWGLYFGDMEDTRHDHPDNCAVCKRRKARIDQQAALAAQKA